MYSHAQPIESCPHVFHSNLKLFACVERNPTPIDPNWAEMACWRSNGVEGINVAFSALDAVLLAHDRNREGRQYTVASFEDIDPRHFIQTHDGWLNLHLAYGFCAHNNRLMLQPNGELQPLSWPVFADLGGQDSFVLEFPDRYIKRAEELQRRAGMYDYWEVLSELGDPASMFMAQAAMDAVKKIENPLIGNDGITQCAMYDPIDQIWKFARIVAE